MPATHTPTKGGGCWEGRREEVEEGRKTTLLVPVRVRYPVLQLILLL